MACQWTNNINGTRDQRKRAIVYELVRHKRVDVVFLQETHSDPGNSSDWASLGPTLTIGNNIAVTFTA
ncbi:hypothetical protein QTP86_012676 [Hemibagrus guttatus]|nr:hypothetical protein QTP86_012676 [Hemibagrus guttatus]